MIIRKDGNIFTTTCHTIVNTVNCEGVMGAGIAYEFRLRFPQMYEQYREFCKKDSNGKRLLDIGKLWIYKVGKERNEQYAYVLNFPTKLSWKNPSKIEYIKAGLDKFVKTYKQKGILSAAFPLLGTAKGGLDEKEVFGVMTEYLSQVDIDIEIWGFNPNAKDDLYEDFKTKFLALDDRFIKEITGIGMQYIRAIKQGFDRDDIKSISGLLRINNVGDKTLERAFRFIINYENDKEKYHKAQDSFMQRSLELY